MHSDLEILESLVLKLLLSIAPENATITTLEELLCSILNEKKKIKHKISETYFIEKDESRFAFYVHQIQQDITYLADQVYNSNLSEETILTNHQSGPLTFKGLQISVYLTLEDLLNIIECLFPHHFNLDALIPNRKRYIAIRQFSDNLIDLNKHKNFISPKLFEIITAPVREFIDDPSTSTYRHLYYLQKYLGEIFKFRESKIVRTDLSNYINRKLIYLNFNSMSFFNFVTSEIKNKIDMVDEISEKLERLSWYLKETNQTLVTPGPGYIPHQVPVKELLSDWIVQEVAHRKKVHIRVFENNIVPENEYEEDFKLITNLSVPAFAFLLRCFIEGGVFLNKGQRQITALTRFFAVNTQTKGTGEIAPGNLRKHYYLDDPRVIAIIRDLIIKILNYINSLKLLIILLTIFQDDYLQAIDTVL